MIDTCTSTGVDLRWYDRQIHLAEASAGIGITDTGRVVCGFVFWYRSRSMLVPTDPGSLTAGAENGNPNPPPHS